MFKKKGCGSRIMGHACGIRSVGAEVLDQECGSMSVKENVWEMEYGNTRQGSETRNRSLGAGALKKKRGSRK